MERGQNVYMYKKDKKFRTVTAARELRKNPTEAEALLWKYLSNRGLCGFKFRRQYPVKGFVLDFYCPEIRLGIELDGHVHDDLKEYDRQRQSIIENNGIRFLRFKNIEVIQNMNEVLKCIKRFAVPSPQSGEGCRGEDLICSW